MRPDPVQLSESLAHPWSFLTRNDSSFPSLHDSCLLELLQTIPILKRIGESLGLRYE